jgi:hypothetical protein
LDLAQYLRTIGYTASIESSNGNEIDEKALKTAIAGDADNVVKPSLIVRPMHSQLHYLPLAEWLPHRRSNGGDAPAVVDEKDRPMTAVHNERALRL